jgi:hypothetical protein
MRLRFHAGYGDLGLRSPRVLQLMLLFRHHMLANLLACGRIGQAMKLLRSENKLEIIPRATHLFEEPGTLEQVALLA